MCHNGVSHPKVEGIKISQTTHELCEENAESVDKRNVLVIRIATLL